MSPAFPLEVNGYKSKTIGFKSTRDGTIKLDIFYPENCKGSTKTVVLHYHGGFLVSGQRSPTHLLLTNYPGYRSLAIDIPFSRTGWCVGVSLEDGSSSRLITV